jgi:hypothetical protein
MEMKHLFRAAALTATLLLAAGCIYPFTPELQEGGELPIVVEGDIFLGSYTTLTLSHVQPFDDGSPTSRRNDLLAQGYIEGEDGTRVEGSTVPPEDIAEELAGSTLFFNTVPLRADQRYRLHFDTLDERHNVVNTFETDWLTVYPAPTIDRLNYSTHEDYDELWVGLTMHCNGAHYFRWFFTEVWEYHSDIFSYIEYFPNQRRIGQFEDAPKYFCWNTAVSSQINIFSTANQTEDRFEELAFHRIPGDDKRLQVLYHITVRLEAIGEDQYNYWNNIQQNSEQQGSLFAPTPSEMASNIHCISDPDLQVIGYLSAAVPAEADLYYDNWLENFYHDPERNVPIPTVKVSANRPDSMAYWYRSHFLPYEELYENPMSTSPSHYMWAPEECIDCRVQGGTKTRPKGWPTDHI